MARFGIAAFATVFAALMALSLGGRVDAGVPSGDLVFVSSSSSGTVDGIGFTSGDILRWDAATDSWSMFFDGSASGLGAANIDGFHIVDPAPGSEVIELSLAGPISIGGLGIVDDSDVLLFDSGALTVLFDGSDVGLSSGGEDIDAWTSDGSGPVASTLGTASVPRVGGGTLSATDEDLLDFDGTSGHPTSGAFVQLVDGSDIGFGGDWVAAWVDPTTDEIYGAALNGFNATGLSGDGDDIFVFTGTTGSTTSGTLGLYFDGDLHRFGGEQIDGLHVIPGSPPPPGSADLVIAINNDAGAAALAGDTVTFTVDVTNNGPDPAMNIVVTETIPAGLTVTATAGCALDPSGLPCSLGDLPPGATASFTIDTTVDGSPLGVVTTSVAAASGTSDPTPGNNNASSDVLVSGPPVAVDDGPATNSTPGDPFHVAEPGALAEPAPGLLANDSLGSPTGAIIGFGGGDLGGSSTAYAAGETAPLGAGSLQVNADGSFNFTPDALQAGPFTFSYRLANDGGFSDAMVTIYVGPRPVVAERDLVYLSTTAGGLVDGIIFEDEDVLVYSTDTDSWEMFFDGSDVGLGAADINGFAIQTLDPDPVLQMTFTAPISLPGIAGTVDDSDVVTFTATSIGSTTAGSFQLLIDGSDVGLSSGGEDVDSLTWVPAGGGSDLAISTWGSYNVVGGVAGGDEDLLRFASTGFGPVTTGVFSQLFDGSDVGLISEDIAGASFDPDSGDIYASTLGPFAVPGLSGDGDDVIVFTGTTGPATAGTFSTFLDGDTVRFGGYQINAVHVVVNRNGAPTANPDRAATDENTPITIGPDYTTSISSAGGDIEKIAIDPRTGSYAVLDFVNGETRARLYDPVNRRVLETAVLEGLGRRPVGVDFHPQEDLLAIVTAGINEAFFFDEDLSSEEEALALDFEPRSVTVNRTTGEIVIGGVGVTKIYPFDLDGVLHTVEHAGLIATGLDIDERTGEIVAVLYEDQGSFGPGQIQRWDADGQFVSTVTTSDLNFPWDLSIDQATGDIAVPLNEPGGNVIVFDENGNLETNIGGFNSAQGVAYDPATGNLAVASRQGSLVDPTSGNPIDFFLTNPTGRLAVQPLTEEILTARPTLGSDSRYATLDPTTRTQRNISTAHIADVATDPTTGRIAVLTGPAILSRQLEIYDPTGTTLLHSMPAPARNVAFHPDTGDVAVSLATTNEIRLYDPTLTTMLSSFPFSSNGGLEVQPGTGNFVSLIASLEVRIYDGAGTQIGTITPSAGPWDVAVDPATGNIAIAIFGQGVEIWDPTGTTLLDTIPVPRTGESATGVAYGGTGNLLIGYDNPGSLDVLARGVLANDIDPDGDPLTVTGFDGTSANGAAVTVNPDGSFTYDPTGVPAIAALRSGETLADTFTYTIGDGNGETDTATATVFVAGVNDAPNLDSSGILYAENLTNPIGINPPTDDSDSIGNGLTFSLIGADDDHLFSIDPISGDISFLTPPDFENPLDRKARNQYRVSVGVRDSEGSSASAYFQVTVTDVVETATITIIQDTVPDDAQTFIFTALGLVPAGFTLDDDGNNANTHSNTEVFSTVTPGTYVVSQGAVSDWPLTDVSCLTGGITDLLDREASITVAAGDSVTCTFTNTPAAADLLVELSDSVDPVVAGQEFFYSTTSNNSGPDTATGVVVTVTLPAGVSVSTPNSNCPEDSPGVLSCTPPGPLAPGTGVTFNIGVTPDAGVSGLLTASVSIAANEVDPVSTNDTATEDTTVVIPSADLSITKSDSADPVVPGDSLTYTLEVSNAGPDTATNVVVTDTLPAGVTLVATTGCAEDPSGAPTCSLGSIAAGGSVTYTIDVTVDSGTSGTITSSASVTADQDDPDTGNNTTTEDTTVVIPFLSVTKVDELLVDNDNDNAADPGDALRYTVTITNGYPTSLNNMVFTDTIDSGTSLSGVVHVSPLAGADSYMSTETGINIPAATGLLLNDTDPDNNVSNSVVAVNGLPGAIGIPTATSEGGSVTVAANGSFDYTPQNGFDGEDTFTYTLSDGDSLTRDDTETVTITVAQIGNALDTPVFVTGQNFFGGGTAVVQSLGTVEPGQVIEIVFDVTVNSPGPASGQVCNQATVTTVQLSPVLSDDPDTAGADDPTCTAIDLPPATPGSAANDAYDSIGNVGIDVPAGDGLLDNDTDGSVTANTVGAVQGFVANVGVQVATTQVGSVTVAADGSFSYTPPVGFEGTDTFTYTIDDGIAGANPNETATVTITVDELIWIIDGNELTQGDGTLNSPFNSIDGTGYEATAADDAGDVVYIFDGPGGAPYSGTITLKDDQVLLGEGSTQNIPTAAGITVPAFSSPLPVPTGSTLDRPVLQTSSGNAIDLAKDNTIRGFVFGNTTGHAVVGNDIGTLVIDNTAIAGTGGSLDLVNGDINVDLNCIQATTASSARPTLRLRDVEGSFNMQCSAAGTLSAVGGQAVDILGRLAGPGDALDIKTLTFLSVSVDGATTGIHLEDIELGSFTVTGSGTTDGSGGTLQNITNNGIFVDNVNSATFKNMNLTDANTSDGVSPVPGSTCDRLDTGTNTGCFGAVKLTDTGPIVLDNLQIDDTGQNGVTGTDVNNLTLIGSVFTDIGSNTGPERENALHIINLTGTSNISGNTFTGSSTNTTRNVLLENSSGTLNLTMNDNNISDAATNGVRIRAESTAVMNVDAVRNTFQTNGGTELEIDAVGSAMVDLNIGDGTSANGNVLIGTPTVSGSGGGIVVGVRDTARATFDILANQLQPMRGSGIVVVGFGGAQGEGRIIGNEVQGNEQGWGVLARAESQGALSPSMIVDISGNTIGQVNPIGSPGSAAAGIEVSSVQGSTGSGTANVQAKIANNTVVIGGADSIIQHNADAGNSLCLDVTNNAGSGAATSPFSGFGSTHYIANPVIGSPNGAGVVSYVGYLAGDLGGAWNANGNTPTIAGGTFGEAFVDGTEPTATASCTSPTNS